MTETGSGADVRAAIRTALGLGLTPTDDDVNAAEPDGTAATVTAHEESGPTASSPKSDDLGLAHGLNRGE